MATDIKVPGKCDYSIESIVLTIRYFDVCF
jgi:hypothetical protein